MNGAERVAKHRARLQAEGAKRITVTLEADAARALAAIIAACGSTQSDAVSDALKFCASEHEYPEPRRHG